ncbi:MAG: hypothetical protein ACYCV7_13310, partial [Acidimicrobiales bacterium]
VATFPMPQLYAEPIGAGGCTVSLTNLGGALDECLYGNLEGLGVSYNGTHGGTCASGPANNNGCYDTGAATGATLRPTSCGSAPLGGCSITGTLDPLTGAYVLNVQSTIQGTSFDGATAVFHLAGTFKAGIPRSLSAGSGSAGSGSAGSGSAGSGSAGSGSAGSGSGATSPATPATPVSSNGANGKSMTGQFQITGGTCNGSSAPNGSWIQLGLGGGPIANPGSSCDGGNYTPLSPGTSGLEIGQFQPNPTPTFDAKGNSLAGAIIAPTVFLGGKFGAATAPQDEQTAPNGPAVFPVPQAVLNGSQITANLSAVNFTYNGSPNSTCASTGGDGCYSVGSADVTGVYDPTDKVYSMQWTATVHGGAFNNATATFHLSGTFNGTVSAGSSTLSQAGNNLPVVSGASFAPGATTTAISAGTLVPPQANELVGTFSLATGVCNGSRAPNGSWIELSKGGGPIPNPSSACAGGSYTPLSQGTVGLQTGHFQPDPIPTFDANGNSLSGAIIRPTKFLGADFGASTDPENEQSAPNGPGVFPAPYAVLNASGTAFTANLSSVNFTYNGTPNGTCASGNGVGCYSVGSTDVAGTYDPSSHAYSMAWNGQVVGGAFNGATASFHFSGIFTGTVTKVAASAVPVANSSTPSAAGSAAVPATPTTVPPFPIAVRTSLPGSGPSTLLEGLASLVIAALVVTYAFFGKGFRSKRRRSAPS